MMQMQLPYLTIQPEAVQAIITVSSCKNPTPHDLYCQQQQRQSGHGVAENTCAVSDSSPDEATRLMGPEAHMIAFTSSCRLSALRNLLSAKMSSTRQALMHETVL